MEIELSLYQAEQRSAGQAELLAVEVDRLRAENAALRHAATHDPLTGLLNRAGLTEQAGPLLDNARPGVWVSVMVLDLNCFKQVNDWLGHAAGDRVLQTAAGRLRRYGGRIRALTARLGGDEFVSVRLGADDPERVRLDAGRLAAWLAQPMQIAGHRVVVGAAVGVAVAETPLPLSELLRRADAAMYRAKGMREPAAVLWHRGVDGPSGEAQRPQVRVRELRRKVTTATID